MKKAISVLLILIILLFSFGACTDTDSEAYPLSVNGTPIDSEIFCYWLDYVWDLPESQGTKEGRLTQATYMCIRYVAVNSTFAAYSLTLTDGEMQAVSDEMNVLWNMFGAYYEGIGVSKQTYLKIRTYEAYIEKLRLTFFDKGGTDEISDAVLRGVLAENYVAFRYIRTPVYDTDVYGNKVEFTEERTAELSRAYTAAANSVASSYTTEKAYADVSKSFPLTEQSYETVVIGAGDHRYSDSFYETVKNTENNKAVVFQYSDYVYLVYKINIVNDYAIFGEYRSECLRIVSEEPLQSKINVMCNAYQSVRDRTLVSKLYEEVADNR